MESSFVSTNFEYYGGIQNLEYEALYQGIISATLLMRGSQQYNSSFTKEGSSSPGLSPLEYQGPSPSIPPRPSDPSPGPRPSCSRLPAPPAGPQLPFESSCPLGMDENSSPVLKDIIPFGSAALLKINQNTRASNGQQYPLPCCTWKTSGIYASKCFVPCFQATTFKRGMGACGRGWGLGARGAGAQGRGLRGRGH